MVMQDNRNIKLEKVKEELNNKDNLKIHFKKDKFKIKYEKQSDKLKDVFNMLVEKCSIFCSNHFDTNTNNGDYRFCGKLNFCLITFVNKRIKIQVLTYNQPLISLQLELKFNNKIHRGNGWYEFYIDDFAQIDEAVRIIKESKKITDNIN